jgi:hypothetical protein
MDALKKSLSPEAFNALKKRIEGGDTLALERAMLYFVFTEEQLNELKNVLLISCIYHALK